MGKKNKKLKKALCLQDPVANEGTAKHDGNCSEITNSTDSMISQKKKRKHASADVVNDTSVQAAIEETIQSGGDELDTSATLETKKKKKKKHHSTQKEETAIENTEIDKFCNDINNDESNIPKKKKKKNKGNPLNEEESTHDIDQVTKEPAENEIKISKKNNKKSKLLNGEFVAEEKSIENVSVEDKPKVTKSQKKKRTGTPVLNAEESQVTEEDIDKFCDELDEEDNKQYEDWVKLIEASLPPPRKNT